MKPESRRFYRSVAAVALPMAVQNLFSSLVSASDTLMLGLLNQASLSAISLASQISFIHHILMFALTSGTAVLAAQYWGRGDRDSVEKVLGISLRWTLLGTAAISLAALLCPGLLMRIFTDDATLAGLGVPYLRIVSAAYLFTAVSQPCLTIMKTTDRVKRSSLFATSALILNILLNAVLIFGLFGLPRMGIAGAALATVLARAAELGLCLWENRRRDSAGIRLKNVCAGFPVLARDFWRATAPLLANMMIWAFAMAAYSAILGHLGSDAVAAHSIADIVKNCVDCVGGGVGIGSGILLGHMLGRGELEQARRDADRFVRLSVAIGVASGLVILLGAPLVLRAAHTLTDQARHYLKYMLMMCSYYMIGRIVNTTFYNGIFTAGGDTRFGFWSDLINLWGVILPTGFVAAYVLRLPVLAVYFILYLDEFTKMPVVLAHYRKRRWLRNLTRDNPDAPAKAPS